MISTQLLKSPAPVEEPPSAAVCDPYVADRYFTDGVKLYRLAGWVTRPGEATLAELEDCHSLRSTLLARDDLLALSLDTVAPGGLGG
jgi:hypothetical protein